MNDGNRVKHDIRTFQHRVRRNTREGYKGSAHNWGASPRESTLGAHHVGWRELEAAADLQREYDDGFDFFRGLLWVGVPLSMVLWAAGFAAYWWLA